jgi:hypothetical protein
MRKTNINEMKSTIKTQNQNNYINEINDKHWIQGATFFFFKIIK